MTGNVVVRRLTAIMFTDVAGYSKLMSTDEARALDVLRRQRETLAGHPVRSDAWEGQR